MGEPLDPKEARLDAQIDQALAQGVAEGFIEKKWSEEDQQWMYRITEKGNRYVEENILEP